jgi:hypothetical protein
MCRAAQPRRLSDIASGWFALGGNASLWHFPHISIFQIGGLGNSGFHAISVLCASFVAAVGAFYLLFGVPSFSSYLRYR